MRQRCRTTTPTARSISAPLARAVRPASRPRAIPRLPSTHDTDSRYSCAVSWHSVITASARRCAQRTSWAKQASPRRGGRECGTSPLYQGTRYKSTVECNYMLYANAAASDYAPHMTRSNLRRRTSGMNREDDALRSSGAPSVSRRAPCGTEPSAPLRQSFPSASSDERWYPPSLKRRRSATPCLPR